MLPAGFEHSPFPDHELFDSGDGEKLERFGEIRLVRPDPQALWERRLATEEWKRADLTFVRGSGRGGRWMIQESSHPSVQREEPAWNVRYEDATFVLRPTPLAGVGVFPEQAANWGWVRGARARLDVERPRLLHLFGSTGTSSIVAVQAGYSVTHVDASPTSANWAKENARASGIPAERLRVVRDDPLAFAARRAIDGDSYHGIVIDPPHYGRDEEDDGGRFEKDVVELFGSCRRLLTERSFLIVSAAAIGSLPQMFSGMLAELEGGRVETLDLALPEAEIHGAPPPRLLPCGACARWSRGLGPACPT